MPEITQDTDNLAVHVFLGEDGVPVVQIDTQGYGPLRINLNDGPIWDANPETHEHEKCGCVE